MQRIDTDGNGELDFEEFVGLMSSLQVAVSDRAHVLRDTDLYQYQCYILYHLPRSSAFSCGYHVDVIFPGISQSVVYTHVVCFMFGLLCEFRFSITLFEDDHGGDSNAAVLDTHFRRGDEACFQSV